MSSPVRPLSVALVQLSSPYDESTSDRVARAGKLVSSAQGARLIVLPELWRAGYFAFDDYGREADLLQRGDVVATVDTPVGVLGSTTCYDLRFPEVFRLLVDGGVEIVVVPAAWPLARIEHWRLLTSARALENLSFVIACNASGRQGDVILGGTSRVIGPWGDCLAEGGIDEEVVLVDIDLDVVTTARAEFPALRDRQLRVNWGTP